MIKIARWHWFLLIGLTLVLRLAALDAHLLSPDEALTALPALEASQGKGWPAATADTLILTATAGLFTLFGAGDGIARFVPALIGSLFVCLPLLWRKRIGSAGAFSAAVLLALSPIALAAARRLDSTIISITGAGLLVTALYLADEEGSARRIKLLCAAGVALGLTGGPAFYDGLLPGLIAWALLRWLNGERLTPPSPAFKQGALIGILGGVLIAIGMGTRWYGWAALAEGLTTWVAGWKSLDLSTYQKGTLILLYEPLTFLLACVGTGHGLKKGTSLSLSLLVWAWVAWVMTLLRMGAGPLSQAAVLLPLALLAGEAIQTVKAQLSHWTWAGEKLHVLLSTLFWCFAGLALMRQASSYRNGMEMLLVLLIIVIQALMAIGFATLNTAQSAWRGLFLGTSVALSLIQLSFAWGNAYTRPDAPAEPLVVTATSSDLRNLQRTLTDLQRVQGKSPETFEIQLIEGTPEVTAVVQWALRDFPALERLPEGANDTEAEIVISPETLNLTGQSAAQTQGMRFTATLRAGGSVPGCVLTFPPVCEYPLKWYFYRRVPMPPTQESVILWNLTASQEGND